MQIFPIPFLRACRNGHLSVVQWLITIGDVISKVNYSFYKGFIIIVNEYQVYLNIVDIIFEHNDAKSKFIGKRGTKLFS
jgi:hypothetical protein